MEMKVADIDLSPHNPRQIADKAKVALEKSLTKWGLVEPLVWNKRTGHLVSGEKRLLVMRKQGVKEVEVSVVDIPEADELAMLLALNSPTLQGRFTTKVDGVIDMLSKLENGVDLIEAFHLDEIRTTEKVKREEEFGQYEVTPRFQEKNNYVVFVFDDKIDFAHIQSRLGLKKVRNRWTDKPRIGLGRVLEGKVLLDLIAKTDGRSEDHQFVMEKSNEDRTCEKGGDAE